MITATIRQTLAAADAAMNADHDGDSRATITVSVDEKYVPKQLRGFNPWHITCFLVGIRGGATADSLLPWSIKGPIVDEIIPEWGEFDCDWSFIRDASEGQQTALTLRLLVAIRQRKNAGDVARAMFRVGFETRSTCRR